MNYEYYRGFAIMYNPINNKYYFYKTYKGKPCEYPTYEECQEKIDRLAS